MTFKQFFEQNKERIEKQKKEDETLKRAITEYVAGSYDDLLDWFVKTNRKKLKKIFQL